MHCLGLGALGRRELSQVFTSFHLQQCLIHSLGLTHRRYLYASAAGLYIGGVRILTIFRCSRYVTIHLASQSTVPCVQRVEWVCGENASAIFLFSRRRRGVFQHECFISLRTKQNWFMSFFKKVKKEQPVSSWKLKRVCFNLFNAMDYFIHVAEDYGNTGK